MTIEQAIKLMQVEVACIERASNADHPCTRECEKCDLIQKSADLLAAYSMAVAALRAQQWISVKDNPPKEDGFYNVYMNGDIWGKPEEWAVTSCGFYDGKWDEDAATISHWMPLPEPPKGDQENG